MIKHCEAVTGILVMSALTVRSEVGFAFYSQDRSYDRAVEPLDRSDFLALLESVKLPG